MSQTRSNCSDQSSSFDVEYARAHGRKYFQGNQDTIGEQYVCEAMRHQWEIDQAALETLRAENERLKNVDTAAASLADQLVHANERHDRVRAKLTAAQAVVEAARPLTGWIQWDGTENGRKGKLSTFQIQDNVTEALAAYDKGE